MMVVAQSVFDPVRDVVEAAKLEHGDIDVAVDVYERSELGRRALQRPARRAGAVERMRLGDFARQARADADVGPHRLVGAPPSVVTVRAAPFSTVLLCVTRSRGNGGLHPIGALRAEGGT